jgi:uncharacterized Zn finger protein
VIKRMPSWGWSGFAPYVSAAEKRARAAAAVARLRKQAGKKGRPPEPVVIEGRKIAATFWGKAWCEHLESFSDFSNRLPRGRTYVRNGSVVDLQILPGKVTAHVAGSSLYTVEITIQSLATAHWKKLCGRCAGQIGSLIDLLKGKLSDGVMQVMTARDDGLFPTPAQIEMDCSCPDYAGMCKHIAAVLYGVGARLDLQPELLFRLREVDHTELITQAADVSTLTARTGSKRKTIAADQLSDVFGIDIATDEPVPPCEPKTRKAKTVKKPRTVPFAKRRSTGPTARAKTPNR